MDRRQRVENEMLSNEDSILFYTADSGGTAKQLKACEKVVRISNAHAFTMMLPSVAEAKGLTFSISVDSASAAVTLTDFGTASYNESLNWEGDYTLDAAEDRIVLKSDGRSWLIIENQIA